MFQMHLGNRRHVSKTAQDRAGNRNKFTIQLLFQNDHNFPINKSNVLLCLRSTLRIVARKDLWECNERRPFWGQLQHWLRLRRFGMCVFFKTSYAGFAAYLVFGSVSQSKTKNRKRQSNLPEKKRLFTITHNICMQTYKVDWNIIIAGKSQ